MGEAMEIAEEYRLKVSVRNNLILKAIEGQGYTNLHKFSKACSISLAGLYDLINLKAAPITNDGEFSKASKQLMEALGACPIELWTEEQLTLALRKNSVERHLSKEALQEALQSNARSLVGLPYDEVFEKEEVEIVKETLDTLTPREAKVISMRFGIGNEDESSLEEIGRHFGVTKDRIRQIETRALYKMRHPSRSDKLKNLLNDE
jgi:RNA polymerase primary sigma factor